MVLQLDVPFSAWRHAPICEFPARSATRLGCKPVKARGAADRVSPTAVQEMHDHGAVRGENTSNDLVQCADDEHHNGAPIHMRQCSSPRFHVTILSVARTLSPSRRDDVVESAWQARARYSRKREIIHCAATLPQRFASSQRDKRGLMPAAASHCERVAHCHSCGPSRSHCVRRATNAVTSGRVRLS